MVRNNRVLTLEIDGVVAEGRKAALKERGYEERRINFRDLGAVNHECR